MAIRVKVRLEPLKGPAAGRKVEVIALVNSGYEAEEDDLSVPVPLATVLGWWPTLPADATEITVQSYTGVGNAYAFAAGVRVTVVEPDRESAPVLSAVTVAPAETEALISDYLGGSLRLVLLDTRTGEWSFADEIGKRRRSYPAQLW